MTPRQISRLAIAAAAAVALAAPPAALADPAFERLEQALPPGWSLLASGSELVLRHDRPCYVVHGHAAGPLITVELRYRLEPKWTEPQLAAARTTNDQVDAELRALTAQYRIDAIAKANGAPAPANPDERRRVVAYQAARKPIAARHVALPRCSLGESSVFDSEATYAQLSLEIDPANVLAQAHEIVDLMKQRCG